MWFRLDCANLISNIQMGKYLLIMLVLCKTVNVITGYQGKIIAIILLLNDGLHNERSNQGVGRNKKEVHNHYAPLFSNVPRVTSRGVVGPNPNFNY